MIEICAIVFKDGRYEAVDIEQREGYSCQNLDLAVMAAHKIAMEWAERHGEASKNDGIDKAYAPIV